MENASDAIIMAGSVFLLIIALTLSITSFSRVKTQIDEIVSSHEKVEYAVNSEDNSLINFIQSKGNYTRTVQIETIVTSLRRIRKENFDVYIIFKNGTNIPGLAEDIQKELTNGGTFDDITVNHGEKVIRFTLSSVANRYVENKNSDNFDKALILLYNRIGMSKFKEYYGVYKEKTADGVSDVEKNDIKIITYVEE